MKTNQLPTAEINASNRSMESPAARAMARPSRRYLMGFAAGHDYTPGGGDIEEPSGDRLRPYQTKVFPTRAAARAAAESLPTTPGKRRYVRPYTYSTPNPENAKAMPLFDPAQEPTDYLDPEPVYNSRS